MSKKYKESLNSEVFTSKYVVNQNSPIVYVAHHEDGAWEFWGNELVEESEIMVISLREIIQIDSTVLEVSDLPFQFSAIREAKGMPWRLIPKN